MESHGAQVLGKNGKLPHAEQPQQPHWPPSGRISAAQPQSTSRKVHPSGLSGGYPMGDAAVAEDLWACLTEPRRRQQGGERGRDIDALAQDMASLDTDIASLEATLHSAGL